MSNDGWSAAPRRAARGRRRRWPALVAAAAVALAACGGEEGAPRLQGQGEAPEPERGAPPLPAPADTTPRMRDVVAVQVAAFADSGRAARMRDSLAGLGWEAFVRQVAGDTLPPWRVRLSPTRDRGLAEVIAAGFAAAGRSTMLVADSAVQGPGGVLVRLVNGGTAGMIARPRWALSPDRGAMLVVEDATGIEGDPLPDGFLYVAERGPMVVQRDSVWDVAPSPDWTRMAYGKAYLIPADGRDSVSIRQWFAVAGRANMDVRVVQRGAFPASGMSLTQGFAQPMIEPLHPDSVASSRLRQQVLVTVPLAGGWRVRWSADGSMLAIGLAPRGRVSDDAAPSEWLALDSRAFLLRGALQRYMRLATVPWVDGPVMDVSVPLDRSPRRLEFDGGVVEGRDGFITVRGGPAGGGAHVVGAGLPLAVTRGGRFVAAIVPVPAPQPQDPKVRVAVYELLP